ncbi:Cdc6/Cdc18 family protein [Haloarchaeobius litoreus]|uniref:Cdc6/Cdc18 family protein n=1 Tax=Haloarchaeobius litoreus TaxID=755306 RepID=A0ABD6DIT2_9EURY|nr:Cdc6/Cdc18 family protein [Haloarchaeobius litoreus]
MIRRPEVLDHTTTPDASMIVHRRDELQQLARAFQGLENGRPVNPVFLTGPSGVGKSLLAEAVTDRLVRGTSDELAVDIASVNCWTTRSRYEVTFEVARQLVGGARLHHDSTPRLDLLDRLQSTTDRHDPTSQRIVVLDEVDVVDTDVLYDLADLPSTSLLLVSNEARSFLGSLDPRIESRLSVGQEVRLEPYTADELVRILEKRVEYGLEHDVISQRQLERIARHADGDARKAISTLREAAEAAQGRSQTITNTLIDEAIPEARERLRQENLAKLDPHQQVLFDIVDEYGPVSPGTLQELYEDRMGDDAKTQRTTRRSAKKMVYYDLLVARGEGPSREYAVATT